MSQTASPINRYLWAVGSTAAQIPQHTLVSDRYQVIAPHIWLDTKPDQLPLIPATLPASITPYLRLYTHRLHLPQVFGFCQPNEAIAAFVLLLDQAPFNANGQLYPSLDTAWSEATTTRQLYWLWQMLQLWQPLLGQGVASSLLTLDNLRVQGWRLWLRELFADAIQVGASNDLSDSAETAAPLGLMHLGQCWQTLLELTQATMPQPLYQQLVGLCQQMQAGADVAAIATPLNQLLLEQAAQLPLNLEVWGATDSGPRYTHNEDTCYPLTTDLQGNTTSDQQLLPYLTLVCDGIGGHEGGEVASQLAVRSLKLQILAMLKDLHKQPELLSPELVMKQLAAHVRVVNNLIAGQNDTQGREARRRMGTTLVLALQLPQSARSVNGGNSQASNSHELYLVHVGDSRAYWITPQYCQLLTVDDDVAGREVRMARSLHQEASQRRDASALTQAMGTRDSEFLRPTIQRFILEEDGLLLLCSDGLTDNGWVEQSWQKYALPVLKGDSSLEEAVHSLVNLANQFNGHDNVSVVLTRCLVSPQYPVHQPMVAAPLTHDTDSLTPELTTASHDLLYDNEDGEAETAQWESTPQTAKRRRQLQTLISLGAVVLIGTVVGLVAWAQVDPEGFPFGSKAPQPATPPTQPSP